MTTILFWTAILCVLYPYALYPIVLFIAGRRRPMPSAEAPAHRPSVSLIVPVSNEESCIARKVENTASLRYPAARLQVIFISDGSTDGTVNVLRRLAPSSTEIIELTERRGKAAALNAGLARAKNEIVVFSDAAVDFEPDAIERLVEPFADPRIGCVSGEDLIRESSGEAWYGRYELLLRRLESRVHSIVGASGSVYAQRRAQCAPFTPGLAPDFLSVLRTVELGYRAVSQASAIAFMTSAKDPRQEFERKVRTVLRGITTLFVYAHLLNPARHGSFAFILFSHKVMRWLAPVFMIVALITPLWLLASPMYTTLLALQIVAYAVAWCAFHRLVGMNRLLLGKAALYFATVNLAVLVAWMQYARGIRQEVWTPTRR